MLTLVVISLVVAIAVGILIFSPGTPASGTFPHVVFCAAAIVFLISLISVFARLAGVALREDEDGGESEDSDQPDPSDTE